MRRFIKPVLGTLLVVLILLQFIHPERNLSGYETHGIQTRYAMPEDVKSILKTACFDCHSNYTVYPWYANVQPVASWLANHVEEGKHHLNFSEFTNKKVALQNHKMEEVIEVIQENEMPMSSYTLIHRDAVLSDAQKQSVINWAQSIMDTLKARYPADSLVLKRRG
ncbi:MAG: heme-binding domain-containing protein [Saprospiraceae bacterium]|nr:heme-binding domain-containing protein [Saprospiraceae bacterium]